MLRLPLVSGNEVCIFGKNISVYKVKEHIYPKTADGTIATQEIVYVEDGTHGNGGWGVDMAYEDVIYLVQRHIGGLI